MRREVAEADTTFQTPEMEHLLEPVSFASGGTAEETLKQLNDLKKLSEKLAQAPAVLLRNSTAARSRLSGSQYASFLTKFEKGFENGVAKNTETHQKEHEYLVAEIDLYEFVLQNFSRFSVKRDQLFVADDDTLNQYNTKLSNVQKLMTEYQTSRKLFEARQSAEQQSSGLSLSDLDPVSKK